MTNEPIIFVDSDAFIALIKLDDSNHEKARKIFEKAENYPINFLTSNFVFSEVITVLSQKVSHQTAVEFVTNMKAEDSAFTIKRVTEEVEEQAIQIFIDQTSKNTSFVDCTNIALIKSLHLDGIFSFDNIYFKNGIKMIKS